MQNYTIPILPLTDDIESKTILRKLGNARAALAEHK